MNLMFDSCFNLVKGPQLPATTLFDNCYTSMFDNSALKKCN